MNPFLTNLHATGTATQKQLGFLQGFINRNGLKKFREYRQRLNISTPLHRMTKAEAFKLINAIVRDSQEAEHAD